MAFQPAPSRIVYAQRYRRGHQPTHLQRMKTHPHYQRGRPVPAEPTTLCGVKADTYPAGSAHTAASCPRCLALAAREASS